MYTANKLLRWGTILLNYNFRLEYLPLKRIGHGDGLSRLIPTKTEPLEDTVIAALRNEEDIRTVLCCTVRNLPVTLQDIRNEAKNDEFINEAKAKIAEKNEQISASFSLCNNVRLYNERVVIPKTLQKRILKDFHRGHPGKNRMKSLMRSYVYWKNMNQDISQMVEICKGCNLAAKAPPVIHKPWPET